MMEVKMEKDEKKINKREIGKEKESFDERIIIKEIIEELENKSKKKKNSYSEICFK